MFKYKLEPYGDRISLTITYGDVGLTGIFPTLKEAHKYLEIGRRYLVGSVNDKEGDDLSDHMHSVFPTVFPEHI